MKDQGGYGITNSSVSAAGYNGDATTPLFVAPRTCERAILHFDGDSFFASVEQAMNWRLRGKPVVTGAERGAATALSYEAKRLGLYRGMPMKEIRAKCPDVIFVKSNYTAYSLYARRMYTIVRRYTPLVEEYSIDECFADVTGLEKAYNMSYPDIAQMIKSELELRLGITFGVGLGPSKVVAKIGSKHRKPAGLTYIPAREIKTFIKDMKVGSLWGVGPSLALRLQGLGVVTALDFASKSEGWIRDNNIAKPYREIWFELNGGYVKELSVEGGKSAGSIISTRTFAPPTSERAFVWAQLSKNIERACGKARRGGLRTGEVGVMLKTQDFLYRNADVQLATATHDPAVVLRAIEPHFQRMFVPHVLYRATGISLRRMVGEEAQTLDLFGEVEKSNDQESLLAAVDVLNKRYGKETVGLASSLRAVNHQEPDRQSKQGVQTSSVHLSLEQKKKTIDLPFLGRVSVF